MKQSKHKAAARRQAFKALTYPGGDIRPVMQPFWELYSQMPYGVARREALLSYLRRERADGGLAYIPVNRHYQANLVDPDLRHLLRQGLLVRAREGGGRRHPLDKTSRQRQTILRLAD